MAVKSYLSPKTGVRKSRINRYGLFATKPIRKGEVIGIKGGHIIDWETLEKNERIIGDSYLQIDDNFVLAPLSKNEVKKVMMFLNHSCGPNVGMRGEITVVAMRNIKAGEELNVDYAMVDADRYSMTCHCGDKNCRKIVTGRDWQDKKLQKKYKGFFSRYIQDKIDKPLHVSAVLKTPSCAWQDPRQRIR